MINDRIFRIALTISIITHTAIFLQLPYWNSKNTDKTKEEIDISYIPQKINPSAVSLDSYTKKLTKKSFPTVSGNKIASLPNIKKDEFFKTPKDITVSKPDFTKLDMVSVKKEIDIAPLTPSEKINNPVYLDYYQLIREMIRHEAYQNYGRLVNGEVYLSFIILRNGKLKDMRIVEEKTSAQSYLQQIAVRSIKDASPFPYFPRDLDYPELSFNVIISFEAE